MPDSGQIEALKNIMEQIDLLISPADPLPADSTPRLRELVRAASALVNDLENSDESPAAILGSKGGKATARKLGAEHFRQLAAKRKTWAGGRPKKAL